MPHSRFLLPAAGIAALAWLYGGPAVAAPEAAAAPGSTSFVGELLAIVLPLAFIILGLFLVLRLLRRRYGLTGRDAPLSVLQIVPVGPRERVVLLRTRAGRVFALGVGANSVNLIARLEEDDIGSGSDTGPAAKPANGLIDTVPPR